MSDKLFLKFFVFNVGTIADDQARYGNYVFMIIYISLTNLIIEYKSVVDPVVTFVGVIIVN